MLKCNKCGEDTKPVKRSHILPSTVWMDCRCEHGIFVPVYIPDEQIEKYLLFQVLKC